MPKTGRKPNTNQTTRIQKQIRVQETLYSAVKYDLVRAIHQETGNPNVTVIDAVETAIKEALDKRNIAYEAK